MDKFQPGDRVMLSDEGRKDVPQLRNKRGIVIEKVQIGLTDLGIYRVQWGRKREIWQNHETNLRAESPTRPVTEGRETLNT